MKKLLVLNLLLIGSIAFAQSSFSGLPEMSNTQKPWTRWWWMGNAVDKENLRDNLIQLSEAGIGGVEITPIYGVKGEEENFIDYLSPKWMEMLDYTLQTADSLGMQVDMVLGTGWPYGGPQVSQEDAATKLIVRKYELKKNERIKEKIQPNEKEAYAKLKYVVAYGHQGTYLDLTDELNGDELNWKAKNEHYTLYAIFIGKTGQQVKRAAPGGKGFTLDHYSKKAFEDYVKPFDKVLPPFKNRIRAIFNDSYEVYDSNFTPEFFEKFEAYRGYDLKKHLPELFSRMNTELANRVKGDYRETLSDLLLNDFNRPWTDWANAYGFKTKLQAHGSPGNLIDLYASADIPECETFGSMPFDIPGLRRKAENIRNGDADPVMLKFSSSAGHIAGRPLISSESFTWLRDHFKTALSQTKPEAEELLLNGVNHMFFHGTTYSPKRAAWPGWKFYASVNMSPNNTIWEDAPEMFSYLARSQQILQAGNPDNETLVYWPIYDVYNRQLKNKLFFQFKIHSLDEWLHGTSFYEVSTDLMKKGYGVDFISDAFIAEAKVKNGALQLPGGSFKALVIPEVKYMPLETLKKLLQLKKEGANIIFKALPQGVPGFKDFRSKERELTYLLKSNQIQPQQNIDAALQAAHVKPEQLVNSGLKYIRRELNGEKIYFLVNHTAKKVDEYIPIQHQTNQVTLFDALSNTKGKAKIEQEGEVTKVWVQLEPGESVFLKTGRENEVNDWLYVEEEKESFELTGNWKIDFLRGGPKLPASGEMKNLSTWTDLGTDAENFSGTASYELKFDAPISDVKLWKLDLGEVRESAKVWLNGEYVGSSWSIPHQLILKNLKNKNNTLRMEVTNLPANRIRAKENRGEEWKIFYEINMVNKDYKEFDATKWEVTPSGLVSPIKLIPLKKK
ncbi:MULTISPECIES: glycosyl hydrolase [Mesonia]|uniref:Uncharacterized protein n=1 Tax=Mesonia oceanica TaxID=2687242 RepID=A0AC61Y7Q9_9FLAO|nr:MULTISPECIES: glycosyl hydrolase [Mesonia]MAN28164.1 glycoside hydrolase [Mesonia sp.]VVV00438.1 hypothetical protein FVB9532_01709 [Mesonia oceanica]|tara:strand:+ start:13242 stop:15944 length:2703 start_codon:yes stop_codon:yes gene_type:complete